MGTKSFAALEKFYVIVHKVNHKIDAIVTGAVIWGCTVVK